MDNQHGFFNQEFTSNEAIYDNQYNNLAQTQFDDLHTQLSDEPHYNDANPFYGMLIDERKLSSHNLNIIENSIEEDPDRC